VNPARLALAAVLVAAGALYLGTLDRFGYWFDEIQTVDSAALSFREMVRARLVNGHPPLFHAGIWVLRRVAGDGEVAMRLPATLFALASALLVHAIAARLARPAAGVLAAALLLALPLQIELAHDARANTLAQCLALLSTWILVRHGSRPGPGAVAAFAGVSVASLLVHFSAAFVVAAQLGLLAGAGREARRMALWTALACAAAILPVALAARELTPVTLRLGWTERTRDVSAPGLFAHPFLAFPPAVGAAVLALGLAGLARAGWRRSAPVTALWLGAPVLANAVAVAGFFDTTRVDRYFAATYAAQCVALALAAFGGRGRALRIAAALAVAGLFAVSLRGTAEYLEEGRHAPWRAVARVLEARVGPDEAVVLASRRRAHWVSLLHYYPGAVHDLSRPRLAPRQRGDDLSRERFLADERRSNVYDSLRREYGAGGPWARVDLPPGTRGVWVYFPPSRLPETAERAWSALRREFPVEEEVPVRGGRLVHRRRAPAG